MTDDFITDNLPEEKPVQKKRRGRQSQDQAISDLPPPPVIAFIDKDKMTIRFPDGFIFLKACKKLEKSMSLEFYAESENN